MKRKFKGFGLVLIANVLTLQLISCATGTTAPDQVGLVIEWPNFPDPEGLVEMQDGVVTMPLDYWLQVAEYVVAVRRARAQVEAWEAAGNGD